jgi:formylglycine-generating enzyme required for sulfatase activity
VGWAYIPAGNFEMGCNSGELDGTCLTNEQPRHTVTMTAYCMELTEVSVGAYRACKNAGVCTGTPTASGGSYNWTAAPDAREAHPINGINWSESREYCQSWMGGDLPSEAQWEKAARGGPGDTRKYPWGSTPEPDCTRANGYFNSTYCNATYPPYTWPVGYLTTTSGDSPYGLKDMSGNVWEWVQDYYLDTFYQQCSSGCTDPLNTGSASHRVLRGGCYHRDPSSLRVVRRGIIDPTDRDNAIGFRCRRTP